MKKSKGNVIKILSKGDTQFIQVATELINNTPEISAESMRVYLHIKSTPNGWHTSVDNIMSNTCLSRAKVIKAIKGLENAHLLKRKKTQEDGRYGYTYTIFDIPYVSEDSEEGGDQG